MWPYNLRGALHLHVEERFRWDEVVRRHIALYEKILKTD